MSRRPQGAAKKSGKKPGRKGRDETRTGPPAVARVAEFAVEDVELARLKPHPKNYKAHPEDQLQHIEQSIRQFGIYRNVVVARDYTILAGHGVTEGARRVGYAKIPVRRLDIEPDSPLALKVLALDNELPKFGEADDRALSEILKLVRADERAGLLGTGFTDQSLAAFLMVTRPESEIRTIDEAKEWVGMPEYETGQTQLKIIITFKTEDDRKRFADAAGLKIDKFEKYSWSTRWPFTEREDAHSLRFAAKGKKKAEKPATHP